MREQLIALINVHCLGLSRVLGQSHEQTLRESTVKELLIYLAMLPDQEPQPAPEQPTPDEQKQSFINEVMSGHP